MNMNKIYLDPYSTFPKTRVLPHHVSHGWTCHRLHNMDLPIPK